MTDSSYEEREDVREPDEAARGQTEADEEGKPYSGGDGEPDPESA